MAMGTGTDAAIEASDLTLVRGDLTTVPTALRLSRKTLGTIKANLFWAFAYNTAAIPLAAPAPSTTRSAPIRLTTSASRSPGRRWPCGPSTRRSVRTSTSIGTTAPV
ncbi:copper-translocating P-type ATPase [Mycobacteroides abscessus subsp. abscessus]|nr:copper-translocating P-type ATPase [Mycobacteroides abscessus subsp. abscessus]